MRDLKTWFLYSHDFLPPYCSILHIGACRNIQVTLSTNTATTTLELGSTTNNTLRCNIHYGYDSCCYRYGHLNVTWYNDDIAINSNPAFSTSGTYLYVSSFGTYYSTLSINSNVTIIHSGTYKCAAKVVNDYGNTYGPIVSASANLTVQSKYKFKVIKSTNGWCRGGDCSPPCTLDVAIYHIIIWLHTYMYMLEANIHACK